MTWEEGFKHPTFKQAVLHYAEKYGMHEDDVESQSAYNLRTWAHSKKPEYDVDKWLFFVVKRACMELMRQRKSSLKTLNALANKPQPDKSRQGFDQVDAHDLVEWLISTGVSTPSEWRLVNRYMPNHPSLTHAKRNFQTKSDEVLRGAYSLRKKLTGKV